MRCQLRAIPGAGDRGRGSDRELGEARTHPQEGAGQVEGPPGH